MHRTKGLLDTSAMMLLLNDMIFFLIYYNFKKNCFDRICVFIIAITVIFTKYRIYYKLSNIYNIFFLKYFMGLIFCKIHGFCINRHKDIFREKEETANR